MLLHHFGRHKLKFGVTRESSRHPIMSSSFLFVAEQRAADRQLPTLPAGYAQLAAQMLPLVRSLVVGNADPSLVIAQEVLNQLDLPTWVANEEEFVLEQVPEVLSAAQCAKARSAVDAASFSRMDSVDDALEFQLNLSKDSLAALVGEEAIGRLWANVKRCYAGLTFEGSVPGLTRALQEPHEIFIRRYTPSTRPWFPFHSDRSGLTVNVALSDGSSHEGGELLALINGCVQRVLRTEGSATVHRSGMLHAVTRMCGGSRYSLIIFFGRICPHADHELVLCDPDCMQRIYQHCGGLYHCDRCGKSCAELDCSSMYHCAEGCAYDLCAVCAPTHNPHPTGDATHVYVGWGCSCMPVSID